MGCFADNLQARDLPVFTSSFIITPESCITRCFSLGTKYAGMQNGEECWCGDSFGKRGESRSCDMRCNGNEDSYCGGMLANSIYRSGGFSWDEGVDKSFQRPSLRNIPLLCKKAKIMILPMNTFRRLFGVRGPIIKGVFNSSIEC